MLDSLDELITEPDFDASAAGMLIAERLGQLYCGAIVSRIDYLARN
jgi:hypothetical protein